MTESGYYPPGAEHDPNAPWNQVDNPEREIEVTVSVTLSKTVKVRVSDYKITDSGKVQLKSRLYYLKVLICMLRAIQKYMKI